MEQLIDLQLMTGGVALDTPALLAFIAFALFYLLVPYLGYQAERRGAFLAALYLLIAHVGVSLVQGLFFSVQVFRSNFIGPGGPGAPAPVLARANWIGPGLATVDINYTAVFVLIFSVLKIAIFLFSLLAFVIGLRSLRFAPPAPEGRADNPNKV
jgi:hypothetical protein